MDSEDRASVINPELLDLKVTVVQPAGQPQAAPAHMPRTLVMVMAVATGLGAANLFLAQPLLPFIARNLHLSTATAGLILTFAQVGYAFGLVFVLPLGDLLERRRLIVAMSFFTTLALIGVAVSSSGAWLLAAVTIVGMTTVIAQLIVPFAASLAAADERGKVVGTVMSGLLLGVLLSRIAAGYLAELGTWRTVYFTAAGAMLVLACVLWRMLPDYQEKISLGYRGLLKSVWTLARTEPVLRRRSLYGFFSFGAFNILWTSISFLLAGSPYHYGPGTIGLFALVGAAGAFTASIAGRLSDRGLAGTVTGAAAAILLTSWFFLWLGRSSLVALLVGIVILDIAVQGLQITNQSQIYRLQPQARSRINSVYMTTYFLGASVGSAASAAIFSIAGWNGVVVLGASFALAVLVSWLLTGSRSLAR